MSVENPKKNRGNALRLVLAALILAATALITVGAASARYRDINRAVAEMSMTYGTMSDGVFLLADTPDGDGGFTGLPSAPSAGADYFAPGNWTAVSSDNKYYTNNIILSNAGREGSPAPFDQYAVIEAFVSAGFDAEETFILQLATPYGVYSAVGTAVAEGSPYYASYGAGTLFRFLSPNGEPVSWPLAGGEETHIPMTVSFWASYSAPGAVTVIATGAQTSFD